MEGAAKKQIELTPLVTIDNSQIHVQDLVVYSRLFPVLVFIVSLINLI
jgi:hypothetical protein